MNFSSFVMTISRNEFHKRYCRVCGSNDGICVDLFTNEGKSYLKKVQRLLKIEINKTDHLPKNICHICMSFISDFDEYRKNCRIVQTKMSNLARNFNQLQEKNAAVESTKSLKLTDNSTPIKQNVDTTRSNTIQNNNQDEKIRSVDNTANRLIEIQIVKEEPPKTNSIDDPVLNESKSELNKAKDWTIQTLPDSNTTLYVCNKCNEMLLSESAIISHECTPVSNSNHILSSNQILPQENDDVKTKRTKIMYYEDD